jgi:hypothetical protein
MPDISIFDQLGQQIIARMGGGSPYGAQVTGSGGITSPQTSYGEIQRAEDSYRRGQADATLENFGKTFSNMANVVGTGAVTTGLSSIAEHVFGAEPGAWGGFQNMTGYQAPTTSGWGMIGRGFGVSAAQAADRNNASRAGGERGALAGGGRRAGDPGGRFGKGL